MIVVMLSLRTLYAHGDINTQSSIKLRGHVNTFKRCIRLRESQQSLIGVLGGKARVLGSIHERRRCTLASATYTYLVDVFSRYA